MSKREYIKTTHYQIFDYWKDKSIDDKGNIFDEADCDFETTIPVVYDWGEPTCMACGNWARVDLSDYNNEKELYSSKEVKKCLDRAHIRADSIGGEDDPSNLLLLCKQCHLRSPDVLDKKLLLSWVYDRRQKGGWMKEYFDSATSTLRDKYNLNIRCLEGLFESDALQPPNITYHQGIQDSTYINAMIQYGLLNRTELNKENEMNFINIINMQIEDIKSKHCASLELKDYPDADKAAITALQNVLHYYDTFKQIEKASL